MNLYFTAVYRYTRVNQIGLLLQYIANNTTTLDFINLFTVSRVYLFQLFLLLLTVLHFDS